MPGFGTGGNCHSRKHRAAVKGVSHGPSTNQTFRQGLPDASKSPSSPAIYFIRVHLITFRLLRTSSCLNISSSLQTESISRPSHSTVI